MRLPGERLGLLPESLVCARSDCYLGDGRELLDEEGDQVKKGGGGGGVTDRSKCIGMMIHAQREHSSLTSIHVGVGV